MEGGQDMKYTAYITIKGETQTKGFKMTIHANTQDEVMKIVRSKITISIEDEKKAPWPFDFFK